MDQLKTYADDRLINGCIYCDGPAETRDHVSPYPENYLPDIKGHTPLTEMTRGGNSGVKTSQNQGLKSSRYEVWA